METKDWVKSHTIFEGIVGSTAYGLALEDRDFVSLVEHLKDMREHALIRNIDAPPNFRGTFEL